jgi:hypothetical protein
MLSSFLLLEAITTYRQNKNNNTPIESLVLCDNEAVVDTINKFSLQHTCLKDYYQPDADALQYIINMRRKLLQSNVSITVKHIKGHQDRDNTPLTYNASLNVEADKLATKSLKLKKPKIITDTLAKASLFIHGLLVTSEHKRVLRKSYLSMDLRAFLESSNLWHNGEIDKIWWKVYDMSIKARSRSQQQFIQKFAHNRIARNYQHNIKYYNYKSSICRACNSEVETQYHILFCTACPARCKIRSKFILDLSTQLDNQRTNDATKTIIIQNVKCYLNNTECEPISSMVPDATKTLILASNEQKDIGWEHWFKGRITQEWATLVNYDIETIKTGKKFNSSEKWETDIIKLNWDFVYDMWIERNKIEHDTNGDPELRKKEKIIEIIQGEFHLANNVNYTLEVLTSEKLISLPMENLVMIEHNIKNAKNSKRKENEKMDQ